MALTPALSQGERETLLHVRAAACEWGALHSLDRFPLPLAGEG